MKKVAFRLLIFCLFLCLFSVEQTFACTCMPLPPIYQAYQDADAVFIGKVISSNDIDDEDREDYDGHDILFNFEVIESFKGVKGKKVTINRGTRSSSCYSGYTVGESYLVYAFGDSIYRYENSISYKSSGTEIIKGEDIYHQLSFCNRTSNLKDAQDQIYFIREMLKGKPEPQIYGSVARSDTDPQTFNWRNTYLEGIKVVLKGKKKRFETFTDKMGIYRFDSVPEDEYVLKPSPPSDYFVYFFSKHEIKVLSDKTVVSLERGYGEPYKSFYADFSLGWDNGIEGRVVDSEGKPVERYVINLLPVSKANDEMKPEYTKNSPDHHGEKGKFWFYGRTPGKYVLAIEAYAPFENKDKKRFFYPLSDTVEKAKVFNFEATTKIENLEVRLPFIQRDINAEIVWSDGTPIKEGVWAHLNKLETGDKKANVSFDWGSSDKNGKLTLQGFEGFEYWIHVEVTIWDFAGGRGKVAELSSKPIKVKIMKNNELLRIIIQKPVNLPTTTNK